MANTKLSALTALATPVASDLVYIVDVSDTTDSADGSSRKLTLTNLFAVADTVNSALVTLTGSQTLTNKTLTAPIIATISNTGTLTLPTSTDTLVGRATTDTLTNKTITSPSIGGTVTGGATYASPVFSGTPDLNGVELIIDADADTSMTADTDDRIDFRLGGSDRYRMQNTGDFDIVGATGNIQVAAADPKRAFYVPANAMTPSLTAPCAPLVQFESTTNDVNVWLLDFDGAGSAKESAEFGIQAPTYWDLGTVTAQFVWYATAGSGTVNWEIQGLARSDDDALDTAYGTLQEVTDTLLATGDVHITAETSAITIGGTPAAGDWLQFRVNRDPANDTNTSDARLMGVRIRFTVGQYNDA